MKFVVKPQKTERKRIPNVTLCAQCKEDPRFCGDLL
jgi:hypothetical protein